MKNRPLKTLNLICFLLFSVSSFSYVPPAININTFNQSKEIHLGLGFGTNGPEQNIAYAIKKDRYVFFNSCFSIDTMQIHNFYSKHYFLEGGIGFTKEVSTYWRVIATGGYAYGNFIAND